MKKAVLLHGICDAHEYYEMDFPSPSNAHWLPWLQQKFLRAGILCQALEMPTPPKPVYAEWAETFAQINPNGLSIVVGHSAGCGFILKYMTQHPDMRLDKLVLVAPYRDINKRDGDFLQITLDPELHNRVGTIDIFYSENEDVEGVKDVVDEIMTLYPTAKLHVFPDKAHFCLSDLGGPEFPQLWDICSSE